MRQPASSDPRKQLVESGYDRIAERHLAWAAGIDDPGRARMLDLLLERLPRSGDVLDLGCGAGFLSNHLAARGHRVTGVDTTPENLIVAKLHDETKGVAYQNADACALPFPDASFDVVCAMDLLEHVEEPQRLIAEASRVLRPGGRFIFHTFNRNWLANLIIIKGVEWFVKNTPKDLHVHHLFRSPEELDQMCRAAGLDIALLHGSRPRFRWPLWRMLLTGKVGDDFAFTFTKSTAIGYTGYATASAAPVSQPRSGTAS